MKILLSLCILVSMVSCSVIPLKDGAGRIKITRTEPKGCTYLGDITGNQGNFFTGIFTSNATLETGARHDLKNKAKELGGDTIYLLTDRAALSGGRTGFQQTNVVMSGSVYKCKKLTRVEIDQQFKDKCYSQKDVDACYSASWRLAKAKYLKSAMNYFKAALDNGWNDWKFFDDDADMNNLKAYRPFKKLVKKYRK